ncbi:MAG: ABC transporter substrate-binding protein [Armatimonadetes bacterium]|nr:ABC transporter substrate-binding protein [Armatimonadota bacterium]
MTNDPIRVAAATADLLDPHFTTDQPERMSLIANAFDPLLARDRHLRLVPRLATGFEVSADGLTWTISLRHDAQFANGKSIEAADVVATTQRFRRAGGSFGMPGVYDSYLRDVDVSAVARDTVRIQLPNPLADFGDVLAAMPIVPEGTPDEAPGLPYPVGSGPLRLDRRDDGAVVFLGNASTPVAAPAASSGLRWRQVADFAARAQALSAGEADLITSVPAAERSRVNGKVLETPGTLCIIFYFNLFEGPCTDVRVRQAINLGFDRQAFIAQHLGGGADLLTGPVSARHWGADPDLAPYPYDPAAAKRLLAEAGAGKQTVFKIRAPSSVPSEGPALANALADSLRGLGLSATVEIETDRPAYAHQVREKNIGDIAVFDSSPLSMYRVCREKLSARYAGWWWQGYNNPAFDEGLAAAEHASRSPDEREAIYRRLYQLVHDDAPWLFLYVPRHLYGVGPRLTGRWTPRPDGIVDAREIAPA